MRKWKQLVWVGLAVGMLSGGCAKESDQVKMEVSEAENPIQIWAWDETFNVKAAKMAAQEYENTHKDVTIDVEIREREEIFADVKNILAAKAYQKLPDIIMIEDYDIQEMLALYEEELLEMTNRMDFDKYVDYKTRLLTKDGKIYGIPFDSGTTALFYRLDILEKAGYTETDMQNLTWKRFIEIGKDVYEKTGISMLTLDPTDFPLVRIIMQSCGQWYVQEDGITVNIEQNDALWQALEIYETLLRTNTGQSVSGWNEFISAFQQGQAASVISGAWIISSIKEISEQTGLWRVAPIPVVEKNENAVSASNVGGSSWYVLKHADQAEEAADFLVSVFGENDVFWSKLMNDIGIVPCVKNPEIYVNFEAEDPFFGGQKVTRLLTRLASKIPTVNYGSNTYEIENILEDEFQNFLVNNEMKESLKKIQMKAEAVTHR